MKTVFSEIQLLHRPPHELHQGQFVPYFESPERAKLILEEIQHQSLGEIVAPDTIDFSSLKHVHSEDYLNFIQSIYTDWIKTGEQSDLALAPYVWRQPGMSEIVPASIFGKLGYYSFDAGTPITKDTWSAARASASTAAFGAKLLLKEKQTVFALCRPPGHHAAANYYGGYCFLNNAAIAAQQLIDATGDTVAILDIDYHHGNGTQSIFYCRRDVLFVSIHADPLDAYPYFSGHRNECGDADGRGFTMNIPLARGTGWSEYVPSLRSAIEAINHFRPGFVVVSLGVDSFEDDPISEFKLSSNDFFELGAELATLKSPVLFVMEGGYAVGEIGKNVVATLSAFANQSNRFRQ